MYDWLTLGVSAVVLLILLPIAAWLAYLSQCRLQARAEEEMRALLASFATPAGDEAQPCAASRWCLLVKEVRHCGPEHLARVAALTKPDADEEQSCPTR